MKLAVSQRKVPPDQLVQRRFLTGIPPVSQAFSMSMPDESGNLPGFLSISSC